MIIRLENPLKVQKIRHSDVENRGHNRDTKDSNESTVHKTNFERSSDAANASKRPTGGSKEREIGKVAVNFPNEKGPGRMNALLDRKLDKKGGKKQY